MRCEKSTAAFEETRRYKTIDAAANVFDKAAQTKGYKKA